MNTILTISTRYFIFLIIGCVGYSIWEGNIWIYNIFYALAIGFDTYFNIYALLEEHKKIIPIVKNLEALHVIQEEILRVRNNRLFDILAILILNIFVISYHLYMIGIMFGIFSIISSYIIFKSFKKLILDIQYRVEKENNISPVKS